MAVRNKEIAIDISADLGSNLLDNHSNLDTQDSLIFSQGDKVPVDIRFYENPGTGLQITDINADNLTLMGRWEHNNAPALNQVTPVSSNFSISLNSDGGLEGTLESAIGIGSGFSEMATYPLTQNGENLGALLTVATVNSSGAILTSIVTTPGAGYNSTDPITIENPLGIDPVEPTTGATELTSSSTNSVANNENAFFGVDLNISDTSSGLIATSGESTDTVSENPSFFSETEDYLVNLAPVIDPNHRLSFSADSPNFTLQNVTAVDDSILTNPLTEVYGFVFNSNSITTQSGPSSILDASGRLFTAPSNHAFARFNTGLIDPYADKMTLDLGECFVTYTNSSQTQTAGSICVFLGDQLVGTRTINFSTKKRVVIDLFPTYSSATNFSYPDIFTPLECTIAWAPYVETELYIEKIRLINPKIGDNNFLSTYSSLDNVLQKSSLEMALHKGYRVDRDDTFDDSNLYWLKKRSEISIPGIGAYAIKGSIGITDSNAFLNSSAYDREYILDIKDTSTGNSIKTVKLHWDDIPTETDNRLHIDYVTGTNTVSDGTSIFVDEISRDASLPDKSQRWFWDDLQAPKTHISDITFIDFIIYVDVQVSSVSIEQSPIQSVPVSSWNTSNFYDSYNDDLVFAHKDITFERQYFGAQKWYLVPSIEGNTDFSSVNERWIQWDDANNVNLGDHLYVDANNQDMLQNWKLHHFDALNYTQYSIIEPSGSISSANSHAGVKISQAFNNPIKRYNAVEIKLEGSDAVGAIIFRNENGGSVAVASTLEPSTSNVINFNINSTSAPDTYMCTLLGDAYAMEVLVYKSATHGTDRRIDSVNLRVANTAFSSPAISSSNTDDTSTQKQHAIAGGTEPRLNSVIVNGVTTDIAANTQYPNDKYARNNAFSGIRDYYWLCQKLGTSHPNNFIGLANVEQNVHIQTNYVGTSSNLLSDNGNISIYIHNDEYGWLKVKESFFNSGNNQFTFTSPIDFDEIAYVLDSDIQANIEIIAIETTRHAAFVEVVNGGIRFFVGGVDPTKFVDFTIGSLYFNYNEDIQLNWFYDVVEKNVKVWVNDILARTVSLPGGYPDNEWSSTGSLRFLSLEPNLPPYSSNQVFNGQINSLLRYWSGLTAAELETFNNDVTGIEIGSIAQKSYIATLDFDTSEIHSYFDLGNATGVINCDFQVSDSVHSYSLARFKITLARDIDYDLSTANPYIIV